MDAFPKEFGRACFPLLSEGQFFPEHFRAQPRQQQGREALMTTTLDGKIKARLAGQGGDIREPDWGPFQK